MATANVTPPDRKTTTPECPFCRSAQVTTTAKSAEDVYWRCQACGQVWNPSRLTSFRRR